MKRKKGWVEETDCPFTYPKVRSALRKLVFRGKLQALTTRVEDGGQSRGWDVMTVYFPHDGSIMKNYGQIELTFQNIPKMFAPKNEEKSDEIDKKQKRLEDCGVV